MSTSISKLSTMRALLSIVTILGLAAEATAQTVQPSNATLSPPVSGTNLEIRLRNTNSYRGSVDFVVNPLTAAAGLNATAPELQTWNIMGRLTWAGADNANAIGTQDIAYINCEQNPMSQFTPSQIVAAAASQLPRAILLYSKRATSCMLNGTFGYNSIYTMINATDAYLIERNLNVMPGGSMIDGWITAETTGGGSNSNNNGPGGPAPPTTVAMSILYSVTGLITLLFLVIIGTGAMRARRNPERYGPRRALNGRARQSRAKGLAMAMLETIPIIKFGDPEPAKPVNRDIELEDGTNTTNTPVTTATADSNTKATTTEAKSEKEAKSSTPPATVAVGDIASGMGRAESVKSIKENAAEGGDGDIGCTICTEDFTAGEDVRLLPCRHKFHPACVDPWLLNVSGTCPLCRHNLNPAEPEAADATGQNPTSETANTETLPPPLAADAAQVQSDGSNPSRSRIARFLDVNRLRHAPPAERIAALRTLREQTRDETSPPTEQAQEPSRRRLRDRLRLGGRSTETPAADPPTDPTTTNAPR